MWRNREVLGVSGLAIAVGLVWGAVIFGESPRPFTPSDWTMCEPAMVERAGAPAVALRCVRDTVVVLQDSVPLPQRPPVRMPVRPQS